jgi:plastocyanin
MFKAFKPLIALSLLPIAAACGGGGGESTDTSPADTNLVVTATNAIAFDKTEYSVAAGEIAVAYQNDSPIRHTLIVIEDGEKVPNFKLVVNKKGDVDTGSITLPAGTYTLFCDVPGHTNMKATLTVE